MPVYKGGVDTHRFRNQKFAHMRAYDILKGDIADTNRLFRWMPAMKMLYRTKAGICPNMVRYIILVYDPASPFRQEYPDVPERKDAVAAFCGFKKTSQYYPLLVEGNSEPVGEISSRLVSLALCDFLKFQANDLWTNIVFYEELYYNNLRQGLLGINETQADKSRIDASINAIKLAEANEKISDKLKVLYVKFTGNDPDAEAQIREVRLMTPEIVADYNVIEEDWTPDWLEEQSQAVPHEEEE
jgi:hypothetical protein